MQDIRELYFYHAVAPLNFCHCKKFVTLKHGKRWFEALHVIIYFLPWDEHKTCKSMSKVYNLF